MAHFYWPISKKHFETFPLAPQNKSDTFLHYFLLLCEIV
jgi:hypothetical protein